MNAEMFAARARKHWEAWLPEKVASLRQEGMLEQALQAAGKLAHSRMVSLMQDEGYHQHEAEEVALAEHVLLPPEAGAGMPDWETQELAQMDREYRAMMRGTT